MDLNTLSYRCTDDNGLSFELLVDGTALATLIGSQDSQIPYWIIDDNLPCYPPDGAPDDPEVRIVNVCSCGEYGCGHAECRVVHEGESVIFCDFDGNVTRAGAAKRSHFSRANYDQVVREIVRRASAYEDEMMRYRVNDRAKPSQPRRGGRG